MTNLRRWLVILRIPLALGGSILFFHLYNRFLLDLNLQRLRTSLSAMQGSSSVGQAEAALSLVDQSLLLQVSQENLSVKTVIQLQYTQGVLSSDSLDRPIDEVLAILNFLTEDQAARRPPFLSSMDRAFTSLRSNLLSPSFLRSSQDFSSLPPAFEPKVLKNAIRMERHGLFEEAASAYQKLIDQAPSTSPQRGILKMRLAYLYQKMESFEKARGIYNQILRETILPEQAQVVHLLLQQLDSLPALERRALPLSNRLGTLQGSAYQQAAFELGNLYLQLYKTNEAASLFHEAALASPEGSLALPCLFKEAWCLQALGRFEEMMKISLQVVRQDPQGSWAFAAFHLMAETYKRTGDYAAAAAICESLLTESHDDALLASLLFQTGSTYLFDLHNPAKARKFFQELVEHFPASPFSVEAQKILEREEFQKPLTSEGEPSGNVPPTTTPGLPAVEINPSMLEGGTPLMSWLENFLPIFVEVFSERLAKYMQAAGMKELSRKYTEQEFKELVVRRVRDRFPGQVSDVDAKIRADGFIGSGTVHFGPVPISVEARIGIQVVEERPHMEINAVRVGALTFPPALRKLVENHINDKIDSHRYPLKIKKYELKDGYALIVVELIS